MLWAVGKIAALVELRAMGVRSTFLGDHMSILGKEAMENSPSSITAFIHVVAVEQELW